MMLPPFCLYIWRSTARVVRNAPSRWIASSFFHLANSNSTTGATIWMPALLTRTSIAPNALITAAIPASTCSSLATSMATPAARLPLASSSRAVASAAFRSRSAIAILAPSRAKTRAISLPMPLAAPVITATLSARRARLAVLDRALSCKFMGSSFPLGGLGLRQVVVNDFAELEGQVGDDVRAGHDLEHRQLGERREGVREQVELGRPGPCSLQIDLGEVVLDQLADAWRAV